MGFLSCHPMEKAAEDSARVRALLDPKVDDLKQPCKLVKEGTLDMTEKGKAQPGLYCFLFHNIFILTKEIKPQTKYKVLIVIKIRSSLKVFREETEEGGLPSSFPLLQPNLWWILESEDSILKQVTTP